MAVKRPELDIQRETGTGSGRITAQLRERWRRLTAVDARARPIGGGLRARTRCCHRHCLARLHPKNPGARPGRLRCRDESIDTIKVTLLNLRVAAQAYRSLRRARDWT